MPARLLALVLLAAAGPAAAQPAEDSLYTIVYDTGVVPTVEEDGQTFLDVWEVAERDALRYANRFVPVPGSRLMSVAVAPYYKSDFYDAPPSFDVRDVRLTVYASDAGRPGAELFALDVEDPRRNAGDSLVFLDVDLTPYADRLDALPDTVYVGLRDAGADDNLMILPLTAYAGPSVSFLYLASFGDGGGWQRFDRVAFADGEQPFANRVAPIRATFAAPGGLVTARDEPGPAAPVLALGAVYPNPAVDAATLTYVLGRAADVRVSVYDALGRRVAHVAAGPRPAGTHAVRLDASGWADGVYVAVVEAGGRRMTARLVRVK